MVHFMAEAVATREQGMPRTIPKISRGALEKIMRHHWPGNVRELKNTLTRALTFCDEDLILAENIQLDPGVQYEARHGADPAASVGEQPGDTAPGRTRDGERDKTRDATARPAPNQDKVTAGPPVAPDPEQLNHRQRELLPRLAALGSVSRQEYQNLAGEGISMRTAQYDLQQMVRLGLMRKEGRGPAQRYVIVQPGGYVPADKGRS